MSTERAAPGTAPHAVAVREEWLALVAEDAIDPDVPICDAHHHLLTTGPYLIEDFLRDAAGGHNIRSTVHVESGSGYRPSGPHELKPVGETEFVVAQVERCATSSIDVAAGIVGFADLALGSRVVPVIEAHLAASDRLRGIRHSRTWHESAELVSRADAPRPLQDARFLSGFAYLERYGLTFDAWVFHSQLAEVAELSREFPGTTIILDHIGGPLGVGPYYGRRDEVLREWRRGIAELAACPNVAVKLGGLGMPMCGFRWRKGKRPPTSTELAEAMGPYYLWCIEQLGADRCMFESNFPPDKVSYSYTVLWNAFKRIIRELRAHDRAALLHDTAVRLYRLEPRSIERDGAQTRQPYDGMIK
jgi:L-fuconolactonase